MQLGWPATMGKMPGKNDWHPNSPLYMEKPKNFNEFIRKIIKKHPGYVTELYSSYTSPNIDFIGKTENLVEDLIKVLKLMDVSFDEEIVRNFPPQNVSKNPPEKIVWDEELKKEVLKLEYAAFVRYGYI